jgi:hypothetical protein
VLAFSVAGAADAQNVGIDPGSCGNRVPSEPLVLWDVTGTIGDGLFIHGTLSVYNNGVASVSSFQTGDVRSADVGVEAAQALRSDLVEAGGMTLCDGDPELDVPATTITMLNGMPDARAHSFSYWVAGQKYGSIQALIENFLGTYFPGFSLY